VRTIVTIASALAAFAALAACSGSSPHEDETQPEAAETITPLATGEFPASLAAFGEGYPNAGDPCRKLGESETTSNWLDDSAVLVGCPAKADAEKLGGSIVENVDGFFLVSIPMKQQGTQDALVPGTDFHATTRLPCAVGDGAPMAQCDAGVKRKWGEDGTTLVEVTKPDGAKRAIFFRGSEAYGADSAQADGSAGWDFKATRKGDESTIVFGPERYVIPDMLVVGG
jgi:hypothetical protein